MKKEDFNPTPTLQGIKDKLKKPCRNNCGRFAYNGQGISLCYRCILRLQSESRNQIEKKTKDDYVTHEFETWTPGRKNRYLNVALKTIPKLLDKKRKK